MFKIIPSYSATQLGLPYPVIVENAAEELLDEETGTPVGVRIPNLEGLVAAVALARCLDAHRLTGAEVRFIRRALGYTQKQLAEALELDANETVSRWENEVRGIGGYAEKALRMLAVLKLGDKTHGMSAAKESVIQIKLKNHAAQPPVITAHMVRVRANGQNSDEWDVPVAQAA